LASSDGKGGWRWRFLSWLGRWVVSILFALNRKTVLGYEHLVSARSSDRPVYLGFWHGRLLYAAWYLRPLNATTIVSRSADGELIARMLEGWGYRMIRGSNRRGGNEAMRDLLRTLEEPECLLAVTMDGPLGPVHVAKEGSLEAARRKNAHLLPFTATATRKWVFKNSWDQFELPKPFGRIIIRIGPPLAMGSDLNGAALAATMSAATSQLEQETDALAR